MTLAQYTAGWLGMEPSAQQLGFLLSMLVSFVLGVLAKVWRDKLRTAKYKRALWRGEPLRGRR